MKYFSKVSIIVCLVRAVINISSAYAEQHHSNKYHIPPSCFVSCFPWPHSSP